MEADEYRLMAQTEETHWWYAATRRALGQLLDPVLPAGGRFLDAGGGTGATGAWLAERGSLVVTDFFADALAVNRELHPELAAVAAADLGRLPFAAGSFDAALCVTVLYHAAVTDPVAAVRELARVVRPGGVVCLWEPGVRRLRRAHDLQTHTARRFSLADLRGVATGAGLVVERATGVHSYLVPAAAAKAVIERGQTSSDLDGDQRGLFGVLPAMAAAERWVLRRVSMPFGLSVAVVARTPR